MLYKTIGENMENKVKFFRMYPEAKMPTRGTDKSAGIDFYVPTFSQKYANLLIEKNVSLYGIQNISSEGFRIDPQQRVLIPTGIKVRIPDNHALIFFNRSGVAVKEQMLLGACVVDEDYTGEIFINLNNVGDSNRFITFGSKITQGVLIKMNYFDIENIETEEELYEDHVSERGDGAMGSTNHK